MKNICLIVHTDTVFDEHELELRSGEIWGTLDNIIGVMIVFRLLSLIDGYDIPVFFTQVEEIDRRDSKSIAQTLDKNTIPIIVDVANVKGKFDCSLENIYRFSDTEIKDMKSFIEHRLGLRVKTKKYTGNPMDEDDSWSFIEKGFKTLSYTIPVQGDYHTASCSITVSQIERATQGLKWLLAYFLS